MTTRGEDYFSQVAGAGLNEFEGAGRSENTWKQYASTVGLFCDWCADRQLAPLPASSETLKAWIVWLARDGYANATIRAYVSGLCTWHRLQGHSINRAPLWETLKGIQRLAPPQRKIRPLLAEELRGILDMLDDGKAADLRDGALLCVGWANAMRRSELVGLDWHRLGVGSDGTGSLTWAHDGLSVELARSKSDQERAVSLDIPTADMPSAAKWVLAWIKRAKIKPGEPVFRPIFCVGEVTRISARRLTDKSAAAIVRKRVIALDVARGVDEVTAFARAQDFSGHSLRAGYCTSAARAGTPEYLIRKRSRHRSAEVVAGYVRAAETREQHGLGKVGM